MPLLLTVVGARPQFIKAAAVSRVIRVTDHIEEVLVHTGQHYDAAMSQVFFDELELDSPAHNLGVGSASHGAQTGRMLERLEAVMLEERPDWVLVYGDTNSTLAATLAAVKLHIPVAHVEAGLRSYNRRMPEEHNRVLTDHAADLLFVPTSAALANLKVEGIPSDRVHLVGDVMYDAVRYFGEKARKRHTVRDALALEEGAFILATVHRAENTDDPQRLEAIVHGLLTVAEEHPIVWPLHPRTRQALQAYGLLKKAEAGLHLMEPVGYLDMQALLGSAWLVVTDSGGLQKEAFFHEVLCVTLRDETEWVELVAAGWNRLCSPGSAVAIATTIGEMHTFRPDRAPDLYGDGRAADYIVAELAAG